MNFALPVGSKLGNGAFSVGKILGQGGFGITYFGGDTRLKRPVAIKEFFPQGSGRSLTLATPMSTWTTTDFAEGKIRFIQEGQILARFNNPHIVRVLHAFEENNTAYIVMDFLRGKNLGQIIAENRQPMTEGEAMALIAQVGNALEEVHNSNLLHRDIKPENILVCQGPSGDPRAVLIDFGTAREFAAGKTRRMTQMLTVGYAPLEQYTQSGHYGPFTDVYALSATLYHMLTGQAPIDACSRATGADLVPPLQLNGRISRALNAAIERGLAIKASERPQTVREFLALLPMSNPVSGHTSVQSTGFSPRGTISQGTSSASTYVPKDAIEAEILHQLRQIIG